MADDTISKTDQLMTNWRLGLHSNVMVAGVWRDKTMLKAARKPKLYRMLRALWRVKNA